MPDHIELTLAGLSRILEHNVTAFSEYGPNHPGLITLPPEAGPNVNPLKIENWAVFLSTATAQGWIASSGTNHSVTQSGFEAVRTGAWRVKGKIWFLKICGKLAWLVGLAASLSGLFPKK